VATTPLLEISAMVMEGRLDLIPMVFTASKDSRLSLETDVLTILFLLLEISVPVLLLLQILTPPE
jgi:hypothetical protein